MKKNIAFFNHRDKIKYVKYLRKTSRGWLIYILFGILFVALLVSVVVVIVMKFSKPANTYTKIETLLKDGNYESAKALCLKKIDASSGDFVIKYYLAEALEGMKDYTGAVLYYEKAAISATASEEEPLKTQMYLKAAELLKKMKQYKESIVYYNMVLDREHLNTKALLSSGEIYVELKNYVKAKDNLEKLLKEKPDNIKGHYLMGTIHNNIRKYSEAIPHFEFILSNSRFDDKVFKTKVQNQLTEAYIQMRNFPKAIELLKVLMQDDTNFEENLVKMINIMFQANMIQEANSAIEKHMESVSKNTKCELYYIMGSIKFKNGNLIEAIKIWQKAYQINSNFKDLRGIIDQYNIIIQNPILEALYSTDDSVVDTFIRKVFPKAMISRVIKRENFWVFKAGDFHYVIYRKAKMTSVPELSEMADIVSHDFLSTQPYTLLSLFGMVNADANSFNAKNVNLFSGPEVLKFVNENMKGGA